MAVRITAIRLTGGSGHQHISRLWWADGAKTGDNTRGQIVDWIENQNGSAYVQDGLGHRVAVGVVRPAHGPKYLRTHRDRVWTDNLLALPRR